MKTNHDIGDFYECIFLCDVQIPMVKRHPKEFVIDC